jgi:uncharacterized protein YcbX
LSAVTELWRYPVKSMQGERIDVADVTESGFAGDRTWALIDGETGKVASAKLPRLWGALLQCRARTDGDRVVITLGDGSETATDDPDVHARLSAFLGRTVELTTKAPASNRYLAAWPEMDGVMPDADRRSYGIGEDPDGTLTDFALAMAAPAGTFFDVSALHVVARETLDRLGEVQPASRFAIERYRPNVVVDGFDAFAENAWGAGATLQLGSVTAAGVIPTMRCIMTTLAQGDLPRDNETLRTLTKTNRIEIPGLGTWSCVGSYAAVTAGGRIAVGDEVVVS